MTTREPTAVAQEPPRVLPQPAPSSASFLVAKPQARPQDIVAALRFLESVAELEKARRAHPERHEALFNEAILIHEYGQLVATESQELPLVVAIRLYRLFIQQAERDPDAADAVRVAKDRLAGIEELTICNFGVTELERKQQAAEEKQRAAEEEVWRLEAEEFAAPK